METSPALRAEATASSHWDEQDLISRARDKDDGALSEIYERYFDRIFGYVVLRTEDRGEAEDITQEVFLKVLKAIGRYRSTGVPFVAWLYRIARNQIIDHVRYKARKVTMPLDDAIMATAFSTDDPQAAAETGYEMEQLKLAMEQLTPSQREVVILRFSSGLPLEGVASIMGKSVGAVKTLQHSAVTKLRKRIELGKE